MPSRSNSRSPAPKEEAKEKDDERKRSNSRSPAPKKEAKEKDDERKRDATPPNAKVARVTVQNLTRNVGDEHLKEIFGTFG